MNSIRLAKSLPAAALAVLLSHPSAGMAAHPAMQEKGYFDPAAYAARNKPTYPISQYRYQLNLDSLSKGFSVPSVPLLEPLTAAGRSETMNGLLKELSPLGLGVDKQSITRSNENKKRLAVYGDGWKLKVYGDGSRVSFRHYGYFDAREESLAKLKRLEPDQLVSLGLFFISEYLAAYIPDIKGEEIIPLGVQYQMSAGQPEDGSAPAVATTEAAAVIFGRKVNGVDVLGKGSKVAILYANDGTVYGFDFDWPQLHDTGIEQKVAPFDEIKARVLESSRLESNAINVQLDRFECGYYDAGQRKRSEVPLQPACFHFYHGQAPVDDEDGSEGLLTMAYVDAIPAGTEIVPDPNWDGATKLLDGKDAVPERGIPGKSGTEEEMPGGDGGDSL